MFFLKNIAIFVAQIGNYTYQMTEKTLGIVLSIIPHNDKTQFVHIYTERLGKITCRIQANSKRRANHTRSFFVPMSVLDLVIEQSHSQEIFSLTEVNLVSSSFDLSMTDPGKGAQCLYMAELLDKTIAEVECNPRMWDFIYQCIDLLHITNKGNANFHLVFTTRLCYLLGFKVDNNAYKTGMQFDIVEGVYTSQPIHHPYYLSPDSAQWLHWLLNTGFSDLEQLTLNREQRNTLLDMMLCFIRIHLPDAGELRSVEVLKQLFV